MNFYVDSGGAILGVDPEKIYQGSANANTIRFVGAFASNVKVTVAFKLPTGVWTTPQLMTASTQLVGVVTSNGIQFNVWEYSIPALVTETFGTVNMQFYVYGDAGSGNGGLIATASSSFQVERGVPITLPDPTDDYETLLTQILSALSQIEGQIPGMEEDITGLQSKVSDLSENKLDKVSGNTTYKQAYAKDTNGDQIMQNYSTENVTNAIVQRDETGNIKITPGREGYMNDGATMRNIADVESEVAKKYDKTGGTIDGNVTVTGDLTVQGTTITENAETLDVKANVITTNSEGVPLINLSGLGIRTDATNVYGIMYDPQNDSVKLGLGSLDEDNNFTFNQGEGLPIAVRDDSTAFTDKHVIVWDAAGDKFVDGGGTLDEKLDKTTETGAVPRAYTVSETGEQSMTDLNSGIVPRTIVYRNATGYFDVLDPAQYTNPVSLRYYNQNVPTAVQEGFATQTALANTQRQVDGLYTLLEQKNEIYVQTATDTYTTRETAGGENIADGVQTPVKKITGKTVKTTNLIPYPYYDGTSATENGITFTVNTDGTITVNGTATKQAVFYLVAPYTVLSSKAGCMSGCPSGGSSTTYSLEAYSRESEYHSDVGSGVLIPANFSCRVAIVIKQGTTVNNLVFKPMLNEGSTALPYMPYFSGLKNAFFKEIVSTGKNLIQYPYAKGTDTLNGVTFTVNNDGTIIANGTATENAIFVFHNFDFSLSAGTYTISGLENGGADTYCLQISRDNYTESWNLYNGNIQFNLENTSSMLLQFVVYKGASVNNVVLKPMLNYGSSALPYEPYTQSVLSLPEAVENGEWNTIDIENGKNILQGFTKTFDGTEDIQRTFKTYDYGSFPVLSMTTNPYSYNDTGTANLVTGIFNNVSAQSLITNKEEGICTYGDGGIRYFLFRINPTIYGCTMDSTDDELIAGFKAYLAAQHTAGNPLVVRYKTEEIQSETDISPSADSYIAWKNGSETIEQGDTDNSIYGAENTVEQDYYLLTAPQEVTKE